MAAEGAQHDGCVGLQVVRGDGGARGDACQSGDRGGEARRGAVHPLRAVLAVSVRVVGDGRRDRPAALAHDLQGVRPGHAARLIELSLILPAVREQTVRLLRRLLRAPPSRGRACTNRAMGSTNMKLSPASGALIAIPIDRQRADVSRTWRSRTPHYSLGATCWP